MRADGCWRTITPPMGAAKGQKYVYRSPISATGLRIAQPGTGAPVVSMIGRLSGTILAGSLIAVSLARRLT